MTELICIVCPKGCHLKVDEEKDFAVTGNGCPRGAEYGKKGAHEPDARHHLHRARQGRHHPPRLRQDEQRHSQGQNL